MSNRSHTVQKIDRTELSLTQNILLKMLETDILKSIINDNTTHIKRIISNINLLQNVCFVCSTNIIFVLFSPF